MARYLLFLVFVKVFLPNVVSSSQCFEPDCSKAEFNHNPFSCLAPSFWASITPCWSTCNGQRQSPVNIRRSHAVFNSDLRRLSFNIGVNQRFLISTTNEGSTTSYKIEERDIILSNLEQFGLSGKSFKLDSFHFHAGRFHNSKGSEHSFDNEFQPMELHLVFYNTKYPDVETAADRADGLVVIGVMVQVKPSFLLKSFPGCVDDYKWTLSDLMSKTLTNIEKYQDCTETAPMISTYISLKNLLPSDRISYYSYQGSLTTPPCSETVTWVLMNSGIYGKIIYEKNNQLALTMTKKTPACSALVIQIFVPLRM
ncbi:nacrein-like protein [Saccostrea echinata]|uniref:nacrein-like protein n=1 Tax=Saccostrea echinata TaxID=191078 RepID=UPI002A80345A|nr:nacrein-like protein [Saccostrea echinata]